MTSPRLLAVSGKMASGKDAVAAAALELTGHAPVARINIGDAIRAELDQLLDTYRTRGHAALTEHLQALVAAAPAESRPDALAIADRLDQLFVVALTATPDLNATMRTNASRALLQELARLHRLSDPGVWVRRHIERAVPASQHSVVLTTDVREIDELLALAAAGFILVRVVVSPETQRARLEGRDGIKVDPVTLLHPNETALDRLTGSLADAFDLYIDNNGDLRVAASTLASLLEERWGSQ